MPLCLGYIFKYFEYILCHPDIIQHIFSMPPKQPAISYSIPNSIPSGVAHSKQPKQHGNTATYTAPRYHTASKTAWQHSIFLASLTKQQPARYRSLKQAWYFSALQAISNKPKHTVPRYRRTIAQRHWNKNISPNGVADITSNYMEYAWWSGAK